MSASDDLTSDAEEGSRTIVRQVTRVTVPEWIRDLGGIEGLRAEIKSTVARFLVGLVIGITADVAGLITGAFAWISGAFLEAGDAISDGVEFLGSSVVLAILVVNDAIQGAVDASGPLAPVVFAIVVVVLGYIVYRLLLAVIEALPVAPGIASLLGLGR